MCFSFLFHRQNVVEAACVMFHTLVVVYRLKDLLGCNKQVCHLPHSHLEVHLRELE